MFNEKTKKIMNTRDIDWMNAVYGKYKKLPKDKYIILTNHIEETMELSEELEDLKITDSATKIEVKSDKELESDNEKVEEKSNVKLRTQLH